MPVTAETQRKRKQEGNPSTCMEEQTDAVFALVWSADACGDDGSSQLQTKHSSLNGGWG